MLLLLTKRDWKYLGAVYSSLGHETQGNQMSTEIFIICSQVTVIRSQKLLGWRSKMLSSGIKSGKTEGTLRGEQILVVWFIF